MESNFRDDSSSDAVPGPSPVYPGQVMQYRPGIGSIDHNPKLAVYLAAPWAHREEAAAFAKVLEETCPVRITRRWWEHEVDPSSYAEEQLQYFARADVQGVLSAELVVVLNLKLSEGKAFEQGIAYTAGIPILIIGDKPLNIFQHLLAFAPTTDHAVEFIRTAYPMYRQPKRGY